MDAVMYGPTPIITMEKRLIPPPENKSKNESTEFEEKA